MEICITKESRVEEGFGHLKPSNNWEAKERDPIGCAESGRHGLGDCAALNPLNQTPDPQVFPRPALAQNTYIPNHDDNTVSVISTVTNKVTATIPVCTLPASVAVTPDGSKVYVANPGSNDVSVIVTSTILVGRGPEAFGSFIQ